MTLEFHVCVVFFCQKCKHNTLIKVARGQNKLFQNASLLMCYCDTLKHQSDRQAIELLLKVQISPDHPSGNTNYVHTPFCELNIAFDGISH